MYQKRGIFITVVLLGTILLQAQQLPIFTQNREYHGYINPASVNSNFLWNEYNISAGVSYRKQWANTSFTPRTLLVRGEYVYNSGGAIGLVTGGYIIKEEYDPFSLTGFVARIGGLTLGDKSYGGRDISVRALSIGFTGGFMQYRLNSTGLTIRDADDTNIVNAVAIAPEIGAGIFYHQKFGYRKGHAFYIGLSSPQILGTTFLLENGIGRVEYTKVSHYYGLIGSYISFSDYKFVEPSIFVSYTEGATILVNVNFRGQLSEYVWLGVGGSSTKALHFEAGVWVGSPENDFRVKIGFGLDNHFNSYGPRFGPSYEINIAVVIYGN